MNDRAKPTQRRRTRAADKPPMSALLEPAAAKAIKRHKRRHANPGVAVELAKSTGAYTVTSPHRDRVAWEAMICDALGTRSESTARTFLIQLTELCGKVWHPDAGGDGDWFPDEVELNMILNFVAGIKPRNEMEAALGAQMVAVHLMQMRLSSRALRGGYVIPEDAAIASKLARTFVMQTDALAKLKGKKTSRQKITVSYEKHEHKHVHVHGGSDETGSQALAPLGSRADENGGRTPLLGQDAPGNVVLLPCGEGEARVPDARRVKSGRSRG